ncbi:MAG TPA: hypothetical protein VF597_00200 [Candidatus Saccharimonadales bacterium]|jgi:hypothetical protein
MKVLDFNPTRREAQRWSAAALLVALVIGLCTVVVSGKASATQPAVPRQSEAEVVQIKRDHLTPRPVTTERGIGTRNDIRCHGRMASTRQDSWVNRIEYNPDSPLRKFGIMVSSGLRYWFCPNNPRGPRDLVNLVMPLKVLFCATPVDDMSLWYNGTTLDADYWDADNNDVNPKAKKLPPTESMQTVCRWRRIKNSKREWMRMSDTPRQSTWVHVHQHTGAPDTERWMRWRDHHGEVHTVKTIQPANDAIIVRLHRIPSVR